MNHFEYRGDDLYCEGVPLSRIAAEVGTPTYIYSQATLTRHYKVFDDALSGMEHLICFSVKANSNLAVLRLLFSLGAGADIVSGGELFRCLKAGGDPKKIVFSGVGKTAGEMRRAIDAGILAFNVESRDELELLDRVAGEMGATAPVSIRVNPDVDPETHPYISTGMKKNKFGIPATDAAEVYQRAADLAHLEIVGIDCHIGSQLTKTSPFTDAAARLIDLVGTLKEQGIALRYIDVGGGLGIRYGEEEEAEPPSPAEYGQTLERALGGLGMTLICEPGRVIVGNAGVLLTRVLYGKANSVKEFTIVDAAFNDLLRPALYGSYHPIRPVHRDTSRERFVTDIVGPICESSDVLGRDRELHRLAAGDLLAIGAAGAYGFPMASNYNSRPRPAEILVDGDAYTVVRRRETLDQLIENEL